MEDQVGKVTESHIPIPTQTESLMTQTQKVVDSSSSLHSVAVMSEQGIMKRSRGRPRKYDVNGNLLSLTSSSVPPSGFSTYQFGSSSSVKRSRGRPRGSGKLQLLASLGGCVAETAGGNFTPHVLTVESGEDVVSKILSFAQKGPRTVCIISATGVVSSCIIQHPGSPGNRYEGRFEILSLSGSYSLGDDAQCKNGMLSVLLAKGDGRVFGGAVQGSLVADGPIQLILASFKQNIIKEIKRRYSAGSSSIIAPKLTQAQQSCPSQPDNVTSATSKGVPDDNDKIAANQNQQSATVNGVGQAQQQPFTGRTISADEDAGVPAPAPAPEI